jgi:hypothetical protein
MKDLPSVSSDETTYFDDKSYMGLPAITFLQWKSMIQTIL